MLREKPFLCAAAATFAVTFAADCGHTPARPGMVQTSASNAFASVSEAPPPPKSTTSGSSFFSERPPPRVDPRTTTALLVAGRAIDTYVVTFGALADLRAIAAKYPGVSVIVAGDETPYEGVTHGPNENVYSRVIIGVVIAAVTADDEPLGPFAASDLREGLASAKKVDRGLWEKIAQRLGTKSSPFSPAAHRASIKGTRVERGFFGVAFDGPDLLTTPDCIHLLPTGPLSAARLASGVLGDIPRDAEGYVTESAKKSWVYGQKSHQETPEKGIRGTLVAFADMEDMGSFAFDLGDPALQSKTLYLFAQYD